jgi:hypothetical protein
VNVYRVAYRDYTSRSSGPEEELPEEDNPGYAKDHEDDNAGVMAAPYLRESYLDIAKNEVLVLYFTPLLVYMMLAYA